MQPYQGFTTVTKSIQPYQRITIVPKSMQPYQGFTTVPKSMQPYQRITIVTKSMQPYQRFAIVTVSMQLYQRLHIDNSPIIDSKSAFTISKLEDQCCTIALYHISLSYQEGFRTDPGSSQRWKSNPLVFRRDGSVQTNRLPSKEFPRT